MRVLSKRSRKYRHGNVKISLSRRITALAAPPASISQQAFMQQSPLLRVVELGEKTWKWEIGSFGNGRMAPKGLEKGDTEQSHTRTYKYLP